MQIGEFTVSDLCLGSRDQLQEFQVLRLSYGFCFSIRIQGFTDQGDVELKSKVSVCSLDLVFGGLELRHR